MADQLLSQADVDALVASLSRSEPPKPVTKPAASVIQSAPVLTAKPAAQAPAPAPINRPVVTVSASRLVEPPAIAANRPVISVKAPANAPKATNAPGTRAVPAVSGAPHRTAPAARPEVSMEIINNLNAKIADLTRQLGQVSTVFKRVEQLEKKVIEMEKSLSQCKEIPQTSQRVNQLSEEVKKISFNLKGTPGYGARHSFSCKKCEDHGHVAVMYKCTSCGYERWYGWWPEK